MSSNRKDKLTQVIQNFFIKTANVIIQSRTAQLEESYNTNQKLNKWFNLDLIDLSREDLKPWKSVNNLNTSPIVIETYLDLRDLTNKQSLILKDSEQNIWNVNAKKSEIVMERWLIEIDSNIVDEENVDLPLLYKKLIIMFRYLYTITKLLPTYKVHKRLSKIKLTRVPLKIGTRVLDGTRPIVSKGRIGLSKAITNSEDHLCQKVITPVTTSIGTLKISVSFRKEVDFQLIDNEETLSTHFLKIDKTRSTSSPAIRAFKAGAASPPVSTSPLSRNESNTSIAQVLKIQRSGSIGATGVSIPKSVTSSFGSSHGTSFPPNTNEQLSSSGSTPKYSSSFLKTARRSSLRTSSYDKGTPTSLEKGTPSSFRKTSFGRQTADDLKDFMKFIDGKQDLKLSYSPNIEDSLGRFQMLRGRNEQLSDSLTASMYSKSASPSLLPPPPAAILSQEQQSLIAPITAVPHNQQLTALQSLRRLSVSPRSSSVGAISLNRRLSEATSSNESLLLHDVRGASASPFSDSGQVRRGHGSFSVGPSNPTIAATPTHARMHKVQTHASNNTHGGYETTRQDDEDDDELLFAMSDMHLPK